MERLPLQFSLDEIRELVGLMDCAQAGGLSGDDVGRLSMFADVAEGRCVLLREQLDGAERAGRALREALRTRTPARRGP